MNYIDEAHVTLSTSLHVARVDYATMINVFYQFMDAANKLDRIKKTLFYGREGAHAPDQSWAQSSEKEFNAFLDRIDELSRDNAANILHGIIGKATEAGEAIEALAKLSNDASGRLDRYNMVEEIGDGFWYDAITLRALGSTLEEAQTINIAKLRRRFPDKFTEHDANNRDLSAEREVLEGKAV